MKFNHSIFILTLSIFSLSSCSSDDGANTENLPTPVFLLAGDESKTWRIAGESNDATETVPSCLSTSERVQDNSYIFFTDNTMEWDNGTVTDGDEPVGACGDFRDLVGTWTFLNDQTLTWTLLRDRDNPEILINTIDTLNVIILQQDSLVLGNSDETEWISLVPR